MYWARPQQALRVAMLHVQAIRRETCRHARLRQPRCVFYPVVHGKRLSSVGWTWAENRRVAICDPTVLTDQPAAVAHGIELRCSSDCAHGQASIALLIAGRTSSQVVRPCYHGCARNSLACTCKGALHMHTSAVPHRSVEQLLRKPRAYASKHRCISPGK